MTIGVTTRETGPPPRVRVLDASLVFAEALARALRGVGLDAVGETIGELPRALERLVSSEPVSPDDVDAHTHAHAHTDSHAWGHATVLLIDADDIAGLYWHVATVRACPVPVVLITAMPTPRLRVVARRLGAKAVLTRETGLDELAAALVAVAGGDSDDLSGPASDGTGLAPPGPPVTERQRQILSLMAMGERNDEIAARLGLSRHTVRTHVQNLLARLGVSSRLAAVVAARDRGLVDPVPDSSGLVRVAHQRR